MALKGDLASVDLAQVFQMLALNQKVGLLSIHQLPHRPAIGCGIHTEALPLQPP